jgi:hypothetical protein
MVNLSTALLGAAAADDVYRPAIKDQPASERMPASAGGSAGAP